MSSRKPDRAPNTVFSLRQNPDCGYVMTIPGDEIQIVLPEHPETLAHTAVCVSRKDARLLAKRINQCLDETRR